MRLIGKTLFYYKIMKIQKLTFSFLIFIFANGFSQQLTLKNCIEKAQQNNSVVKLAEQSLETRTQLQKSNKNNNLPKVDFLGGYNLSLIHI